MGTFVQSRYSHYQQQKSHKNVWLLVLLCLWTAVSTIRYESKSEGMYFATICSGDSENVILIDGDGNPVKSKDWCLDCIIQAFTPCTDFTLAELILNKNKITKITTIKSLSKPNLIQYYFQTGPPERV